MTDSCCRIFSTDFGRWESGALIILQSITFMSQSFASYFFVQGVSQYSQCVSIKYTDFLQKKNCLFTFSVVQVRELNSTYPPLFSVARLIRYSHIAWKTHTLIHLSRGNRNSTNNQQLTYCVNIVCRTHNEAIHIICARKLEQVRRKSRPYSMRSSYRSLRRDA